MNARYRFLPWVRQGAATAIARADTLADGVPGRAALPLLLSVNHRPNVPVMLQLYSPGDVIGFDTRTVVRTDPPNLSNAFEPNYFPSIEFGEPSLPWLLTPAAGDGQSRLRPWLCLVVVRKQPGVTLVTERNRPLPVLAIVPPARPALELPDLSDAWAWAHSQVLDNDNTPIVTMLTDRNYRAVSRLVCARRLEPGAEYIAGVVPAFAAGRSAGLGDPPEEGELTPAWNLSEALTRIELPVYFHWEFSTGKGGDFESLVRRLRGRTLPAGVGKRTLHVGDASFGLPDAGALPFEGVLRPTDSEPIPDVRREFRDALLALVNEPERLREASGDDEPLVAPPIYGAWVAALRRIDDASPSWLRASNLDPRYRAASGLGTLVVQDHQEQLMASAWEQLGAAGQQNASGQQQELARTMLRRVHAELARSSPEQFLRLTGPLQARVRLDASDVVAMGQPVETAVRTVREQIRFSSLPVAVSSASFRRITRPHGPVLRRVTVVSSRTVPRVLTFSDRFTDGGNRLFAAARERIASGSVSASLLVQRARSLIVLSTMLAEAAAFNGAVDEISAYLSEAVGGGQPPGRPALPLAVLQLAMLKQIDPARTLPSRITPPGTPSRERLTREADAIDSAAQPLPGPSFPQPMYEPLRDRAPEALLPGLGLIPPDSVLLLETNPAFIEAYMLGLNHEMSRELLWREYPSDVRATCFRRFWGGALQMPEIHRWTADSTLGTHLDAGSSNEHLVLLVRSELLQRYPQTVIYAMPATSDGTAGEKRYPIFRAALTPDTACLGFELTAEQARGEDGGHGWFFVLEQPPGQTRFGLDENSSTGRRPSEMTSWNELAWGDMAESLEQLSVLSHAPVRGHLLEHRIGSLEWGLNAGHMAAITLQRPVRVLLRASEMLPPTAE